MFLHAQADASPPQPAGADRDRDGGKGRDLIDLGSPTLPHHQQVEACCGLTLVLEGFSWDFREIFSRVRLGTARSKFHQQRTAACACATLRRKGGEGESRAAASRPRDSDQAACAPSGTLRGRAKSVGRVARGGHPMPAIRGVAKGGSETYLIFAT